MPSVAALELVGISHAYGSRRVLVDVSLTVPEGQLTCLTGPSGCGKTTLLKIVAGLVAPRRGNVKINGKDASRTPTEERNLGFVFQSEQALFPHMNVWENVAYAFKYGRKTPANGDVRATVNTMLKKVGLEGHASSRISDLSGGLKQRLAITRALVYEPAILLLDEPLSSLDNHRKSELVQFLLELRNTREHTFLYVTHDDREIKQLGDNVAVIGSDGALIQAGTLQEVMAKPANEVVHYVLKPGSSHSGDHP